MKVLHTNCDYIWTQLHQLLVNELQSDGVDNTVFSPVYTVDGAVIDFHDNEIVSVCFKKLDRILFHYKQHKIINALEDELVRKRGVDIGSFDILHSYYLFTDGNYTRKIAKKYDKPYVVAVRNTDVNTFFKYMPHLRHTGVKVLLDAERVFFLSETYRKNVVYNYVPQKYRKEILEKSIVIPNGIDDFWLENKYTTRDYKSICERIAKKELRLVYAGVIDKNKNIGLTIKAAECLIKNGWKIRFDVIGPVVNQKVYSSIITSEIVSYSEKLPKEELIKKYREADIFVMPSHNESFGLVYAEAMSQGLPIIYTRGQGFDEHFSEGEVGYSVDDRSYEELVDRVIDITRRYQELSLKALDNVAAFNWKHIAERYEDLYNEIVSRREKHIE